MMFRKLAYSTVAQVVRLWCYAVAMQIVGAGVMLAAAVVIASPGVGVIVAFDDVMSMQWPHSLAGFAGLAGLVDVALLLTLLAFRWFARRSLTPAHT
jgi:hypothetical protein